MSSRLASPLVVLVLLVMVAVGVAAGWLLERRPVAVAPLPPPPAVVAAPEEVAVDVVPPPREVPPGPDAEVRAVLNFVRSVTIHPDPRIAEGESKPVLDRIAAVRELVNDQAQLKELAAAESAYKQRLTRAADAWLVTFAEAHSRVEEKTAAARRRVSKETLRAFIKNPIREPNTAAADLAHLRQTQLEAVFHRAAGKDHGETSALVTELMQTYPAAADLLEAIDDEEADARVVHPAWRGEVAARFAKNASGVKPPEVAAWLLSGCFPAAKPQKPSGADFAFLDPTRNPALVTAAEKGPVRRLLNAWAANHANDPAATAAAAALLKASAR